jgi:hypothetical protein
MIGSATTACRLQGRDQKQRGFLVLFSASTFFTAAPVICSCSIATIVRPA